MNEIWRNINGYVGKYQVSNLGRVKSLKRVVPFGNQKRIIQERIIPQYLKGTSLYYQVGLSANAKTKWFLVHRLVAKAFPEICGEWFEGCEVNHKDEQIYNNVATNLEVCNSTYNLSYGTCRERAKEKKINGKTSKPVVQYDMEWNYINEYPSVAEAKRQTGITNIASNLNGYRKHAGGFLWRFK